MTALKAADFFTLPPSLAVFAAHFPAEVPPWEWLRRIGPALEAFPFTAPLPPLPSGVHAEGPLWIHPTVKLPHHATLIGPAYLGANTEIRPGAWVRGNVIVGEGCVLGNACEYKNCLLMDGVATPHYNYVGDSILGNHAHLGAGAICSTWSTHSLIFLYVSSLAATTRTLRRRPWNSGRRPTGAWPSGLTAWWPSCAGPAPSGR